LGREGAEKGILGVQYSPTPEWERETGQQMTMIGLVNEYELEWTLKRTSLELTVGVPFSQGNRKK
jgi:hypothetical protein